MPLNNSACATGGHPLFRLWQYAAGHRRRMVIAHRLSTVRHAEKIWVLENGGVAESGTHDELVESGGRYTALWRVQTGDAAPFPLP